MNKICRYRGQMLIIREILVVLQGKNNEGRFGWRTMNPGVGQTDHELVEEIIQTTDPPDY